MLSCHVTERGKELVEVYLLGSEVSEHCLALILRKVDSVLHQAPAEIIHLKKPCASEVHGLECLMQALEASSTLLYFRLYLLDEISWCELIQLFD